MSWMDIQALTYSLTNFYCKCSSSFFVEGVSLSLKIEMLIFCNLLITGNFNNDFRFKILRGTYTNVTS